MNRMLLTIVSFVLLCRCESPDYESQRLISNLRLNVTPKTLLDTYYIASHHFIITEYLDPSDTSYGFGTIMRPIGVGVTNILPTLDDSCYWSIINCKDESIEIFIDQVKPFLCDLWLNGSLHGFFYKLGIESLNPKLPEILFPSCVRSHRDVLRFLKDDRRYYSYLWCIHDDSNCFIVIVPRFEYMEEKVLNCEDILIVRAYE